MECQAALRDKVVYSQVDRASKCKRVFICRRKPKPLSQVLHNGRGLRKGKACSTVYENRRCICWRTAERVSSKELDHLFAAF